MGQNIFNAIMAMGFAKIIAFMRTALCASLFGITWQTDVFYLVVGLVMLTSNFFSSLSVAVVPIRAKNIINCGIEQDNRLFSSFLNLIIFLTVILSILLFFLLPDLLNIFAGKLGDDEKALALTISRLLLPVITFNSIVMLLCGLLNVAQKFTWVQCIGIPLNVFWFGVPFLVQDKLGIYAMVIGFLLGTIAQLAILVPPLKGVFNYFLGFSWNFQYAKKLFKVSVPIFISYNMNALNYTVNLLMAAYLVIGGISAISYATQLISAIQGMFITTVSAVTLSTLSLDAGKKNINAFKDKFIYSCILMIMVLLPITIYGIVFNEEIISIVFKRGAFDDNAAYLTRNVFVYYAMGLLPLGVNYMLMQCFYSLQETKIPMIATAFGVLVNALLGIFLSNFMGIQGLALSTTVSLLPPCIIMAIILVKKVGHFDYEKVWACFCKLFFAGGTLTIVCLILKQYLLTDSLVNLLVAALIGFPVYFFFLILLDMPEVVEFLSFVKVKIRFGEH